MSEEGFFSRWARRKNEVRKSQPQEEPRTPPEPVADQPAAPGASQSVASGAALPTPKGRPASPAEEAAPLPSMTDVARLSHDSDYSAFMRGGVDEDVKRAAMKKLFTDPHYNVMDGLDIYIDDYSKPDPIPAAMLRKMAQSQMLGLFRDEEAEKEKAATVADATSAAAPTHDSDEAAVPQSRAEEASSTAAPATEPATSQAAAPAENEGAPTDSPAPASPAPERAAGSA